MSRGNAEVVEAAGIEPAQDSRRLRPVADLGQSGSDSTIPGSSTERYPSTTCATLKPGAARSSPDTSSATTNEKTSSPSWSRRPGSSVATIDQAQQRSLPGLGDFFDAKWPTGSEPEEDGRPGDSRIASMNGHFPRSSQLTISWEAISEEGLETLRQIALPISCGLSEREVAQQLRVPLRTVKRRLSQLRREILEQQP